MADKLLTSQEWLYSISYLVITRTSEIPSKQSIEPFHVDDNYILLASVHEITSYARKTKIDLATCFGFTMTDDELLRSYYNHLLQALL